MKKLLLILLLSALAALAGCAADPNTGRHDIASGMNMTDTESSESAESRNDQTAEASVFLGEWECELDGSYAMLAVTEQDDVYFGFVVTSRSPEITEQWEYPLQFQDGKMVCSGTGLHSVWDDSKLEWQGSQVNLPDALKTAPNQSAEFSMTPEGIRWNDLTGERGDQIIFRYLQPFD